MRSLGNFGRCWKAGRADRKAGTGGGHGRDLSVGKFAELRLGCGNPPGGGELSVVMVSTPRVDAPAFVRETPVVTLRRTPIWTQEEPILDLAVLEEASGPSHIVVLDPETIAFYRWIDGRWQPQQSLPITHSRPWPRDMRGRLIPRQDHLFDIYLPGMFCQSASSPSLSLVCHASDDPWPLSQQFPLGGFYATTRNFFTGVLSPGLGKQTSTAKFYSAAPLPRPTYTLWIFAGVDGGIRLLDGITEQTARLNWGSDLASIKTTCGSGWQVLATQPGDHSGTRCEPLSFRIAIQSQSVRHSIFRGASRPYGRKRRAAAPLPYHATQKRGIMKLSGWQWLAVSSGLLCALASGETRPQYGSTLRTAMRITPQILDPADKSQPDSVSKRNLTRLMLRRL